MLRRLALPVLVVLAAVLGGLLPRLAGPAESSTEVRFVREMIQHHAQAVDMATRVREASSDPQVRVLALDIMLSQQEQIGQMRGWLTLWKRPWAGAGMDAGHAHAMGMATQAQVENLSALRGRAADVNFLQLMIRHHQGALGMVGPALNPGVRPEVQALARQIQATQSAEVALMTRLLRERGAQPLPTPASSPADMDGMQH
ncbi:DUF305 domain-containing protein [Deinococcus sp.]|uniref:DUF305 domain-containing protein n=1 Tax=Deinococcus sp. TaxID=47478 RepID=UPI0025BEF07C|nr:DUF305 domain-containing protein [Deinococcus sp.]